LAAGVLRCWRRASDRPVLVPGGGTFEVWAEPFVLPSSVHYDTEPLDLQERDAAVVERIFALLATHDVRWRCVEG
jgi:hypothetical protein